MLGSLYDFVPMAFFVILTIFAFLLAFAEKENKVGRIFLLVIGMMLAKLSYMTYGVIYLGK